MRTKFVVVLTGLLLLMASCASVSRVDVSIIKPPVDLIVDKPNVVVFNVNWKNGNTEASERTVGVLAANAWQPQKWSKMLEINLASVLKKNLITTLNNGGKFSAKDIDILKENLKEGDIDGIVSGIKNSIVLDYQVLSMNTEIKDLSYVDAYGNQVVLFDSSVKARIISEIFDGDTGALVLEKEHLLQDSASAKNYDAAFENLKTIQNSLSNLIATDVAKSIGPYMVTETRIILASKSNDERMVNGRSLTRQKKYQDAFRLYTDVYNTTGEFEAGFNSAIVRAADGKVEDAYRILDKLYSKTKDPRAKAEMDWLKQDIRVAALLQQ